MVEYHRLDWRGDYDDWSTICRSEQRAQQSRLSMGGFNGEHLVKVVNGGSVQKNVVRGNAGPKMALSLGTEHVQYSRKDFHGGCERIRGRRYSSISLPMHRPLFAPARPSKGRLSDVKSKRGSLLSVPPANRGRGLGTCPQCFLLSRGS